MAAKLQVKRVTGVPSRVPFKGFDKQGLLEGFYEGVRVLGFRC